MAVEALTIDVDGHALLLSADRAAFDPRAWHSGIPRR